MFKDFSAKELKYYFGLGFLFFILDASIFTTVFFNLIYNSKISLYLVLFIHDLFYFLSYFVLIGTIRFFFNMNLGRAILFIIPQFYVYEYISGIFVEGLNYFIFAPKVIIERLIILAIGTVLIYFSFRCFTDERHN
ncbi:MAG: hypothetical protein ACP5QK_08900 [Myxococcota bacterium]